MSEGCQDGQDQQWASSDVFWENSQILELLSPDLGKGLGIVAPASEGWKRENV